MEKLRIKALSLRDFSLDMGKPLMYHTLLCLVTNAGKQTFFLVEKLSVVHSTCWLDSWQSRNVGYEY